MTTVKQRKILYISGFDPRGASAYHKLMREGFAQHCRSNDLIGAFTVRRRGTSNVHNWDATVQSDQGAVNSQFSFLDWGPMVRQFWTRPNFKAVTTGAVAAIGLFRLGMPQQMYRLSWPILITNMSPLMALSAWTIVGLTVLISLIVAGFASLMGGGILITLSLGAAFALWNFLRSFNIAWIGRINRFVLHASQTELLQEWSRPDEMADALLAALDDETNDEILLVSHSIGTNIALLSMERAIIKNTDAIEKAAQDGRFVFITLGQTIPAMAPNTSAVTQALRAVNDSNVLWLDVSAPADPACFALTDPCREVLVVEPRVRLKNAQLYKNFSAETYKAAQKDRFMMHFLYLKAPDSGTAPSFDFYAFLSSSKTLASTLSKTIAPSQPYFSKRKGKA